MGCRQVQSRQLVLSHDSPRENCFPSYSQGAAKETVAMSMRGPAPGCVGASLAPLCPQRGDRGDIMTSHLPHGIEDTCWPLRHPAGMGCPGICQGRCSHPSSPSCTLLLSPLPQGQWQSGSCFPGEGISSAPWGLSISAALEGGSREKMGSPPPFATRHACSAPARLLPGALHGPASCFSARALGSCSVVYRLLLPLITGPRSCS